jgi:hypothetical protein
MNIEGKKVSRNCGGIGSKLHSCSFDLLEVSAHSRMTFLAKIQDLSNDRFIPADAHHIHIKQKYGPNLGIRILTATSKLKFP